MQFHRPVQIGDQVSIYADMQREGRTSMSIGIEVWATQLAEGTRTKVTQATFTFVAIDENGRSRPLP